MALTGIQIFKLTPKKNCKECGSPTCMAFSMKVAQGAVGIDKCPYMSEEALAELSEATAPPMKTITIGAGDEEHKLGGETVLFRHEKTLVSKNLYAVTLTAADDADAKLASIAKIQEKAQTHMLLWFRRLQALTELWFWNVQMQTLQRLLWLYVRMESRS